MLKRHNSCNSIFNGLSIALKSLEVSIQWANNVVSWLLICSKSHIFIFSECSCVDVVSYKISASPNLFSLRLIVIRLINSQIDSVQGTSHQTVVVHHYKAILKTGSVNLTETILRNLFLR